MRECGSDRRGCSLTELVALVALAGVTLPLAHRGVTAQRRAELAMDSSAIHRELGQFQSVYAADNRDDIACVNTSGAPFMQLTGAVNTSDELYGDTSSSTPTQTFDWISPIAGDAMGFSPNRARRVQRNTQTEAYTDPTLWYPTGSRWTGASATPESIEWVENNLRGDILP